MHVVCDSNKLFQYFLFEEKFHKKLLGSILLFGQLLQHLAFRKSRLRIKHLRVHLVGFLVNGMELLHQRLERRHVFFSALNFLVLNHPIKPFAGIQELFTQRDILLCNETKFMQVNNGPNVRLFNSF